MKKTIIALLLTLAALAGRAQEEKTIEGQFKMNEESINDYIPLLKAKGYEAFSFDVSAIKGQHVTIHFREYVNGKEVEDSPKLLMPYTFETRGDKLIIGTLPSEKETFIPLVFYCSFWYDEKDKVTRCCGENYIAPDLSSDIPKHSPHYYTIGIIIH